MTSPDTSTIRQRLRSYREPVLVCGHSYGGAVITAAAAGLPGVVELVYLAAFQLQEGESCADRNPPTPNAAPTAVLRGDYLHADPLSAPDRFYGDCTPADAAAATARLTPEHVDTVRAPVRQVARREIPSTYIVCGQDAVLPAAAQYLMAERAERRFEIDTGHSSMLSRPAEVAEILLAVRRDRAAAPARS